MSSSSAKLRAKHPELVPVVCLGPGERAPGKAETTKLLCPRTMTHEQFKKVVMEKAPVPSGSSPKLYVKDAVLLTDGMTIGEIDSKHVSSDGYVYVEIRGVPGKAFGEEANDPAPRDAGQSSSAAATGAQEGEVAQVFQLDADDSCGEEEGDGNALVGQRSKRPFEVRLARSKKIIAKYPDRIPVHVVQPSRHGWPAFDKKFLTPKQMDGKEFKEVIRKQIPGGVKEDTWSEVLLFANNDERQSMLNNKSTMQDLYDQHKASDLLLYITFDTMKNRLDESSFGGSPSPGAYPANDLPSWLQGEKLRDTERELTIAKDTISVKEDKIAALELTVQDLQHQLMQEQERRSSSLQKLEEVGQQALAATDACRIAETNVSDLKEQLLQRENQISTCQMVIQQHEVMRNELQQTLQEQREKNEQLVRSFQTEREQWESKQAEIATKEGQELRQELEAETRRCAQLWDKVQQLQASNETLQKDLEVVKLTAEAAEKSYEARQAMAFQEKAQRAERDEETIRNLQTRLRDSEAEKDKAQEKLKSVEAELAQKLEIEQDGGFVKIESEEDEGLNFYKIG